jgi:hypothetical protein
MKIMHIPETITSFPAYRVLLILLFSFSILIGPGKAAASTYYVDSAVGSDSYDGLSGTYTSGITGPWASIDKVNATTLNPGDSVLFKKGGIWRGHIVVASSGTAGNPITFASYGEGDRPIINPSIDVPSGNWTLNGSVYSSGPYTSHLFAVYEDGLPILKATDANLTDGYWYFSGSSPYTLYYKPTSGTVSDHSVSYINESYYGAAWDTVGIDLNGHSYITIDGLDFQDAEVGVSAQQPGFECASCSITLPADDAYPADFTFTVASGLGITDGQMATAINVRNSDGSWVESNQVSVTGTVTYSGTTLTIHVASADQKTGAAGTVVTNGRWRIALDSTGTEHITVRNCSFEHNFGAISAFNAYGYGKVGNNDYWLVEDNYVYRGATGFEWGSQWYAAAPAGHLAIQNNELADMGTIDGTVTWSTVLRSSIDQENIGMQNVSNTTVQDNYIHGGSAEGIYFYADPYGVSSDNVTTRNFVRDNGARGFILQSSNRPGATTDNNVASYNIFLRSGEAGGSTIFVTQGTLTTNELYSQQYDLRRPRHVRDIFL